MTDRNFRVGSGETTLRIAGRTPGGHIVLLAQNNLIAMDNGERSDDPLPAKIQITVHRNDAIRLAAELIEATHD